MAKILGKEPFNLDSSHLPDFDTESRVSLDLYSNYKENYIKMEGTPEEPFWEIVVKTLSNNTD